MPSIILVAGGIGCGKTTFINHLLQSEPEHSKLIPSNKDESQNSENADGKSETYSPNLYAIHFDDLCSIEEQGHMIKSLGGLRNFRMDLLMAAERLISSVFSCENCVAGPLTERSHKLLEKLSSLNLKQCKKLQDAVIMVEDNFYYRSMRYDWFQIARRSNFGFATIFLKCSVDIAMDRNSSRGYQIPEAKIKKMLSFIEYPDPSKYKWEKFSLVIDSTNEFHKQTVIGAFELIGEAMKHPAESVLFEQKLEAQKICSKNAIHQADKILRKILSRKIEEVKGTVPENSLKPLVMQLVDIRHHMLLDMKKGDIHLPEELVDKIQNLGIDSVLEAYEECLENLFDVTLLEKSVVLYERQKFSCPILP